MGRVKLCMGIIGGCLIAWSDDDSKGGRGRGGGDSVFYIGLDGVYSSSRKKRNEKEIHSIQIKVKRVCVCASMRFLCSSSSSLPLVLPLLVALLLSHEEGWKKGGGA